MTTMSDAFDSITRRNDQTAATTTIGKVRQQVTSLRRDLAEALRLAQAYTDPHLNDDGITARRRELRAQTIERASTQADQLRARLTRALNTITTNADRHRPGPPTDAAGLIRHQQAWDRCRMRLEAGTPLPQVLATATLDEAVALAAWAPTWLQANHSGRDELGRTTAPDTDGLNRAIDTRLIDLAPDAAASALRDLHDATTEAAATSPLLDYVDDLAAGRTPDPLASALASRMALDAATTRPDDTDN